MLTKEEKAERTRKRMLQTAMQYSTGTYIAKFVATVFQKMIRAEAAALPESLEEVVINGDIRLMLRKRGQCVCITCGTVKSWNSGLGGMHTGHFLASRRNSILFDEMNVAPQCSRCNRYESGAPERFRIWMEHVRGQREIQRLEALKRTEKHFTKDELVDMRIEFGKRLRAAEERMKG